MQSDRHKVVIVGGGFGGLYAARSLKGAPVEVTLIDRHNYHLFQPLLYQVATGALSPANIAAPLRSILKRQKNVRVLMGEVVDFDPTNQRVILRDGHIEYDTLIVATGCGHNYFGHDQWKKAAPGLKGIADATEIRGRILSAFEHAEREPDAAQRRSWLTFVVIGAGPTGVELAGALAEIARHTLRHDFRDINPADARIILVDAADRVLPTYPPELSGKALESLERLGVAVRCGVMVSDIRPDGVTLHKAGESQTIAARTTLWAAGVKASPLGASLSKATGAELDSMGRVIVEPQLTVRSHPRIFVIGDLAHCKDPSGKPLPGIAPVAMQQGRYVAQVIKARAKPPPPPRRGWAPAPFRYRHHGSMATIGRAAAVADLGAIRFSGYLAWLIWLFFHLMYIVEFENRVLIFVQWAWNYFTRNRSARLITGADLPGETGEVKENQR